MNIVSKFRNKYSCGYDDINMVIVKTSIQSIIKPLTNICNKSLEKGIFPDDTKIAKIVPLFKGGIGNSFLIIDLFLYYHNFPKSWKNYFIIG